MRFTLSLTLLLQAALLFVALEQAPSAIASFEQKRVARSEDDAAVLDSWTISSGPTLQDTQYDVASKSGIPTVFENADDTVLVARSKVDDDDDDEDEEYDELEIITVFLPNDEPQPEGALQRRASPTVCPPNATVRRSSALQTNANAKRANVAVTTTRTKTVTVTKTIYETVYRRCTQYIKRATTTSKHSSTKPATTTTKKSSASAEAVSTKKTTSTTHKKHRSTSTTTSKPATTSKTSSKATSTSTTSSKTSSTSTSTTSSKTSSTSTSTTSSKTSSTSTSTTSSKTSSTSTSTTSSKTSSTSTSTTSTTSSKPSTTSTSTTTTSSSSTSTTSSKPSSTSTSATSSSTSTSTSTTSSKSSSTSTSSSSTSTTSSTPSSTSTSTTSTKTTSSTPSSTSTTTSSTSSSTSTTSTSTRTSTTSTTTTTPKAVPTTTSTTSTSTSSSSTTTTSSSPTPKVYSLVANYAGNNFYKNMYFFTYNDPTNGYVDYIGQSEASSLGMIKTTSGGQVYMGYATTRIYPPAPTTSSTPATTKTSTSTSVSATGTASVSVSMKKRATTSSKSSNTTSTSSSASSTSTTAVATPYMKAVRVSSFDTFTTGVFILDASHMPVGCGTWPAWWTVPTNPPGGWPNGGEIDIVEGISYTSQNTYSVHTAHGCTVNSTNNAQLGSYQLQNKTLATNCASFETGNQGCGVQSSLRNDFGVGYNNMGGGIHAMVWDADLGIKSYFWKRSQVPADVTAGSPDPSKWGTPQGSWPAANCDPNTFFFNHVSVFTNTICGDWAGDNTLWRNAYAGQTQSCAQKTGFSTCQAYVQSTSVDFSEAYWLINSVKIYQTSRIY